jgi:addiction module RelE/StbE family toxin
MNLNWSPAAGADRHSILRFIAEDNLAAALRVDQFIQEAVDGLLLFPAKGRIGRVNGTRELVIPGIPYLVIYVVEFDQILILRILHGAMRWPVDF